VFLRFELIFVIIEKIYIKVMRVGNQEKCTGYWYIQSIDKLHYIIYIYNSLFKIRFFT